MPRLVRQRRRIRVIPRSQPLIDNGTAFIVGTSCTIIGSAFGGVTAIARLNGIVLTSTSWTNTAIQISVGDHPFTATWQTTGLGNYPLYVADGQGGSVTTTIVVSKRTADQYVLITSITGTNSIFANDSSIVVNTDYVYWRTLTGSAGVLNGAGQFSGATLGSTGRYAIWNPTTGWSNTANVTISGV